MSYSKFGPQCHTQNFDPSVTLKILTPMSHSKFKTKTAMSTLHVMLYPQVRKYFMEAPPLKFWCVHACVSIMFHCYRSVSVLNRLGTERSWNSSIPGMDKRVHLPHNAQTACGFHPAYYSIDTGCSLPGEKRSGPELDHCAPSSVGTQLWIL